VKGGTPTGPHHKAGRGYATLLLLVLAAAAAAVAVASGPT
jgi:hypothetical protein